jgi:hypothetical protein
MNTMGECKLVFLSEGVVDFIAERKDVVVIFMHVVSSHDVLGVEVVYGFIVLDRVGTVTVDSRDLVVETPRRTIVQLHFKH